jgi:hypothetical protein
MIQLGLALLALSSSACSDSLAPASQLTNLRLIAVEADKPAAQAGETVNLRALYANPDEQPLSWGYALCDGASSSAALDCLRALDPDSLEVSDDASEFTFTMPAPSSDGQRPVSIGVAVIVCPGRIVRGDTHGVPIACEVNGEPLDINDYEMGVKRIFYADAAPNQNPTIRTITFDGQEWAADEVKRLEPCTRDTDDIEECKARFRHLIKVEGAEGDVESFRDNDGNQVLEQVVVQFYATGGLFEWDVRTIESADPRFVALKRDAGHTLTMHFVIRDSRGGVSWETRTLEISP